MSSKTEGQILEFKASFSAPTKNYFIQDYVLQSDPFFDAGATFSLEHFEIIKKFVYKFAPFGKQKFLAGIVKFENVLRALLNKGFHQKQALF